MPSPVGYARLHADDASSCLDPTEVGRVAGYLADACRIIATGVDEFHLARQFGRYDRETRRAGVALACRRGDVIQARRHHADGRPVESVYFAIRTPVRAGGGA